MMHNLAYSKKQVKRNLRPKLPDRYMGLLRMPYKTIRKPGSIKKHLNRLRYDRSVLRRSKIDFIPPIFVATITDNCNLRCPTCLYLLRDPDKFTPSYITAEKFRAALEKYKAPKMAETVFLTGGEPLLHPEIEDLVSICKDHGLTVKISTNGVLIKNKISRLSRVDYINVSMDAYDYESYEKARGGAQAGFDSIMEGLGMLRERDMNFSVSYLLSTGNIAAIDKMLELSERIKPRFVVFHNINPHGSKGYTPLTLQDENTRIFLAKMLERRNFPFDVRLPHIFDPESPSFREAKCVQPWYYFCFNSDGDVSYCCHLSHGGNIGNIHKDYDFNTPKMVSFREVVIKGDIQGSCLYCQRRFMGKEFARFSSKAKRWTIER
ncbi:MAG: radical SAM protein [Candidatus Omnitrophota bacterium]